MQNATGIVAMYQTRGFWLRLSCARGQNYADALRAVDQEEGGLPPAIAGAFHAATRCDLGKEPLQLAAPHILAAMVAGSGATAPARMSKDARRQCADRFIFAGGDLPASALDRAAVLCAASDLLWRPGASRADLGNYSAAVALFQIAALRHGLYPPLLSLQLGHAKINVPAAGPWDMVGAWAQFLEWDAGQISQQALNYLHNGQWPNGAWTVDRAWEPSQEGQVPPGGDKATAMRIAYALIEDAERNAVYSVSGAFVVELPNGYPLRAWNVAALRVWADQDGLWVAMVGNDGKTGISFRWQPRQMIRQFCVAEQATGLLHATLAALWRDMQVAGEEALPQAGQPRSAGSASNPAPQGPKRITLPRRRRSSVLSGRRQWGNDQDREIIRAAHTVRGHLRHLASGWEASQGAERAASLHGLVLPDGFTFVRPHTRGQGSAPYRETVVAARGLNTVMTLL
jgi:hypothetical protein